MDCDNNDLRLAYIKCGECVVVVRTTERFSTLRRTWDSIKMLRMVTTATTKVEKCVRSGVENEGKKERGGERMGKIDRNVKRKK